MTDAPNLHDEPDGIETSASEPADPKEAARAEKEARRRAKAEAKQRAVEAAKEAKRRAKEEKLQAKAARKAAKRGTPVTMDADGDHPEHADPSAPDAPGASEPGAVATAASAERHGHPNDAANEWQIVDTDAPQDDENAIPLQTGAAAGGEPPQDGGAPHDAEHEVPVVAPAEAADGGAASDEAGGEEAHAPPRLGLRLGVHQNGGLLQLIKAKLGLSKDRPDEATAHHQEEEEALAERIEPDERYKEIETYPIHPPYAHVRILFDDDMKEYVYQVLEPVLTKTEREILEFIETTLVDTLSVSPEELEDADELEFITERFNDVIFDYSIILHEDEAEEVEIKKKLLYYIRRNFIGHGPVDVIMEDPFIEDISCDGPHVPIFLYHRKYESMRSTVIFGEHDVLDSYVIKMAQRAGKHISIAEPILDATMTDGSRLQATLAKEVSAAGSTFTIRKFRPDPFTPPDLVMFRTMSAEMLAYLWIAVQNGASIMYAGGTASGKTTSLNAILLFIPPNMKIVSIEDTREVNLPHENWIAGITRHGFGPRDQFGRQAGDIDMFQLLKNALRQRPEYIIVGEVRGQEAYSLFQAMATGHAAYGTMHADSVDAVIHRLESDPINIPRSLLEALDIVSVQIQTRVDGKRVRRTKQISEIVGLDPHTREILTNEVFRWQPEDDSFKFSGVSYSLEKIQMEKGLPSGAMIKELKRRARIIAWMIDRKIQNYKEVNKVVSAYYKEPETVMKLVGGELDGDEIPVGLREIALRGTTPADGGPLDAASLIAGKVSMTKDENADPAQARSDAPAAGDAPQPTEGPANEAESPEPTEPTERAHEWAGTEAFLQSVEEHESPAGEPEGAPESQDDMESWLSEREGEAREAHAAHEDELDAHRAADDDADQEPELGPGGADETDGARGRRARRASGGEDTR